MDADGSKSGPAKDSVEQNGVVGSLPLCTVTVCVVTVKGFSWYVEKALGPEGSAGSCWL